MAHINSVLEGYLPWLDRQPFSPNTRIAYRRWVEQFVLYLNAYPAVNGDPLGVASARDYAVRDFKSHLKTIHHAKPASVNLALAALDHFYTRYLQMGHPRVEREELPNQAPRALSPEEQRRFLRAVDRQPNTRDQAIGTLLFYTALRISECVQLNVDDVMISERKGQVTVRMGKGNRYREVPLNASARSSLQAWLDDRHIQFPGTAESALFLTRRGNRCSIRSVDLVIRKIAQDAGLTLSAHTLRHTCLTNLVRNGHDLVMVAELAGHKRLDTTRRYSLPSDEDRAMAMEGLKMEV